MSALWGNLIGVFTVLLLVGFIGIWVWAWRRYHKPVFDRMARLPLEDDSRPPQNEEEDPK